MHAIDIGRIRAETKGCKYVVHFNNAGSSLMPDPVADVVLEHLELERKIGGYEALEQNVERLDGFYTSFAKFFNCESAEIAYVENATRAWDMAFYSIPFRPGDRIITTKTEYVSNYLSFLQMTKRSGVVIDVAPNDDSGQVSLQGLEEMISDQTKLISITHVPTHQGLVNPVEEIGRIANKYKILYLLDACQSTGQIPIDVRKIGCDLLSATGRKFLRGPRGTGVLYVKNSITETLEPPFIDLKSATWYEKNKYKMRPDAKRFENWERYVAGQIGLARAVEYALEIGVEAIWLRVRALGAQLRQRLNQLDKISTHDIGSELSGIVTFSKENESAESIMKRLSRSRINTDVARVTSAQLDMGERNLSEVVRASVHYFNTETEIDRFCEVLTS
ncbi:MAG: aminotransferase class V-fold PLP-dependent enzyme [Arenicellales bacterium]|nr:aminotransferase class V-fold PLP-dependent enzyme [Arenicellales bacterium]